MLLFSEDHQRENILPSLQIRYTQNFVNGGKSSTCAISGTKYDGVYHEDLFVAKEVITQLQMWIINYVWTGDSQKKRAATVKWRGICKPTEKGGLGLRGLQEFNNVGLICLAWQLIQGDRQWTEFMKARYYRKGSPISYYRPSSIWSGIKTDTEFFSGDVTYLIGIGRSCLFWNDPWLNGCKLSDSIHIPEALQHTARYTF